MKTRGLFLSTLMMGAVLAGCSNEDVLNDVQVDKKNVQSESYVAIRVAAPASTGSRATDGGFSVGSENVVHDLVLVFFDSYGNFYDSQERSFTWEESTATGVEMESNVVVVFDDKAGKPASFVALLNTGKSAEYFKGKKLDQIKADTINYCTTNNDGNYFVMSNSVFDNDGIQVAAPITDDMICSTKSDAEANPAIAYVERVAVKLEAKVADELKVEGKEVTLDGNTVTLTPTITGMKFVHTASASNLLKNIDGFTTTAPFTNWNDASNYRSYWANSYTQATYNTFAYEDAVQGKSLTEYANENTSATTTKLLVTATIAATKDGNPVDIYKYKGYYYTEEGLKTHIASILKGKAFEYTIGEQTGNDWAEYLTVTHPEGVEQWEGVIGLSTDITVSDEVKSEIAKLEKVLWWKDGKCYFYVPVEHFGGKVGVVRNHWYDLRINSIAGLGTPVADESEEIVPGKIEEETYYVAAQVQILKWKMVSQSVDLN